MKPDLWHDEAIGEVSLQARLTFIGLITQADDEGRQKGDARLIRSLIFPYDSVDAPEVSGWLDELSEKDLIDRYLVGGKEFIELPSWSSHQKISHPTESALPSRSEADSPVPPEDSGAAPEDSPLKGRERKGKEGKGRESAVATTTDAAPLANLLADLVAANDPNGKRPNVLESWILAEDRMLRIDERDPAEAERLIRWTQDDEFWRGNVLSMPKFREKYGQLYNAAVAANRKGKSAGMAAAERLAAKARQARAEEGAPA